MRTGWAIITILSAALITGCAHSRPSNLTPGAAKRHIETGVTPMSHVIEVFGSPNIVTRRDGGEMWVYDKVSSQQTDSAFGLAGVGVGADGSAAGGMGASAGRRSSTRSETTVMLIIHFDEQDVVSDYKITQTKF